MLTASRSRGLLPAAILLVAASGAGLSLAAPDTVAEMSRRGAAACEIAGPAGWIVLVAGQIAIAASGVLPASLFGVLAGTLYGPVLGFTLAATGTLIGAGVSFRLGRAWSRRARGPSPFAPRNARLGAERLRRIDGMIARDGWRAVCLLRLSPVMPFALTSWALSLSRVSTGAYLGGTLASLPPLLAYVLLGSLGQVGSSAGVLRHILLALGAVATLFLAVQVKRALSQEVEQDLRSAVGDLDLGLPTVEALRTAD